MFLTSMCLPFSLCLISVSLVVPVVVPLLVFLYNGKDPRLFGFPRFYWMQLAFVGLGVVCTAVVYRMTRGPK